MEESSLVFQIKSYDSDIISKTWIYLTNFWRKHLFSPVLNNLKNNLKLKLLNSVLILSNR